MTTVRGILVGDGGAAGTPWCLVLDVRPWRPIGSPISDVALRLEIPVPEERIGESLRPLNNGVAVEVDVVSVSDRPDRGDALAIGVLPIRLVEADPQLAAIRAKLDEPVVVDDAVLGRLTLNRRLQCFEGKRTSERAFDLTIARSPGADDQARDQREIAAGRDAILAVERGITDIEQAIADKLLDLYNDTWRDEDDPVLDATAFVERLTLQSVDVQGAERTTAYFDDGGLFVGHLIEVRLDSNGPIREIMLAG